MKLYSLLFAALFSTGTAFADGFLHTEGQDIVNDSGQKVMLRGVGLGNWLLPEGYMWHFNGGADRPRRIEKVVSDLLGPDEAATFWHDYRRNFVTEADIARIAELGFNSVRPALNARLFLSEGPEPHDVAEGYEMLDNLVSWAKKNHIYVIIDMHAAPGGETGQNIDDSIDDRPGLWMEKENQDRLVNLWVKIAKKYANEPAVAGYDLLNEPLPKRTGADDKYKDQLQPLYQRITRAIREVDQKHFVTVEGSDWANDWSAFTPPAFDKNIVYQFHYYCWNRPQNLNGINQYLEFRNKVNAPVWVGETGEANDTIYWATTDYFESNNIGWSFWPWKKMEGRNGIYWYPPPADWDQIVAYARGGAASKPSIEVARRAFSELLNSVRIQNARFQLDVANSLLRRAPVKIEAEDYGHGGLNVSYFVKHPEAQSKLYRKSEPVPIEASGATEGRWQVGQAAQLTTAEWTSYALDSQNAGKFHLTIRARSEQADPSTLQISVNGSSQDVVPANSEWSDYKLQPINLRAGPNTIKVLVKSGAAGVDWLNVTSE